MSGMKWYEKTMKKVVMMALALVLVGLVFQAFSEALL
jgi:hypothetical protein